MLKRAFSLVELMVVLAILLILTSLVFAIMQGSKRRANEAVCISQLRQLGAAMVLYSESHEGAFPKSNDFSGLVATLRSSKVLHCPQDSFLQGANSSASQASGGMVSYVIVSILGERGLNELRAVDSNYGLAICFVHGTPTPMAGSGAGNPLSDFDGPVLQVRNDLSVDRFLPKKHCFDQGTNMLAYGRTVWDLFTEAPIPKEIEDDFTGGMPIVPCR